jgi:hypothetical protein
VQLVHIAPAGGAAWITQPPSPLVIEYPAGLSGKPPTRTTCPEAGQNQAGRSPAMTSRWAGFQAATGPVMPSGRPPGATGWTALGTEDGALTGALDA